MATAERSGKNRHLANIVAQFGTAMLVSANHDGRHRARPRTIANRDANEPSPAAPGGAPSPQQVSFVTNRSNGLVEGLAGERLLTEAVRAQGADAAGDPRPARRHGELDPSGAGGAARRR